MIPLSVPSIQGNEWKYLKECIDSEWVSSAGKYVSRFEQDIANFTKVKYAVACINGTAALQVALRLVGIQAGEEVIVPTITFIAPINVVKYFGALPVFMDADRYYNIDIKKTLKFIEEETYYKDGFTYNKRTGKLIRAIIPVHVFGNAVDLERLIIVCRERNIKIIEDATESLGTKYTKGSLQGKYTGTIGDIGCFSFNGNKIITTGGGGMLVTNDEEYAKKANYLTNQAKDDVIRAIHHEVGYNFRLTNIQAAIGVAQLEKLPEYLDRKKSNYFKFKEQIDEIIGLKLAETPEYANSNYWFYALQIDKEKYGKDREELMTYLSEKKIQTRPVWYLNHLQKPYRNCQSYKIENAFKLMENTLNIPCSVNLTINDIEKVISLLK